MHRRRPTESDSLELLLDTICNTFGGVLFVALLIVILVRLSGHSSVAVRQQSSAAAVNSSFDARMSRREAELKSLQNALREHRANMAILEPYDAKARSSKVIHLRNKLEKLSEKRLAQAVELASNVEAKEKRQREQAGIVAQIAALKTEQDRLARQLRHEQQVRSRTAQLPVLHSTTKAELPAILRFGRLFFPYKSFDDMHSRSLNVDDFLILDDTTDVTRVTPKPYSGVLVDASKESNQAIADSLGQLDRESSYLAVAVWEDSFEQFAIVKDTLVHLGLEYRLVPVATNGIVQEAEIKESLVQ